MSTNQFGVVSIVGVGLIGASLGLALKGAGSCAKSLVWGEVAPI